MPLFGFFKKRKKDGYYCRTLHPREKYGSKEYLIVTQSQILHGVVESKSVRVEGIVASKPKIITRIPPPIVSSGGHDHYTFFILEEGVKIGYPGIAFLKEGDRVTVFGTVRGKGQIVADRIVTETSEYEIQL